MGNNNKIFSILFDIIFDFEALCSSKELTKIMLSNFHVIGGTKVESGPRD